MKTKYHARVIFLAYATASPMGRSFCILACRESSPT